MTILAALPRRNEFIFSSPTAASGRVEEPRIQHVKALAAAGLPALSLHGLCRSFGTLAKWVEVPTGIVAQIMGHKPSVIAEKHYIQRELDLLHMWQSVDIGAGRNPVCAGTGRFGGGSSITISVTTNNY